MYFRSRKFIPFLMKRMQIFSEVSESRELFGVLFCFSHKKNVEKPSLPDVHSIFRKVLVSENNKKNILPNNQLKIERRKKKLPGLCSYSCSLLLEAQNGEDIAKTLRRNYF